MKNNGTLLDIKNLRVIFELRGRILPAVDDVNLSIEPGQTLGLVGESGCGKSVTAGAIMGLIPSPPGRIERGEILFHGQNLVGLKESAMKKIRGNRISMIFQEPMTSLNPVFTVGDQVGEVFNLHRDLNKNEVKEKVVEMLNLVGIPEAAKRAGEFPHQLSGGMRQRVMIAMALACDPELMIADEPTTALDVTIQAQILDLMNKLKEDTQAAILFITHDLGVIAEMAQKVAVMYAGRVMEVASVMDIFNNPKHPYTVGLMSSIPKLGASKDVHRLSTIAGTVPSLFNLPKGCRFVERCSEAMEQCHEGQASLIEVEPGHQVRCHKYV
jgi:peptide/nickel transport system ATP-binding protein